MQTILLTFLAGGFSSTDKFFKLAEGGWLRARLVRTPLLAFCLFAMTQPSITGFMEGTSPQASGESPVTPQASDPPNNLDSDPGEGTSTGTRAQGSGDTTPPTTSPLGLSAMQNSWNYLLDPWSLASGQVPLLSPFMAQQQALMKAMWASQPQGNTWQADDRQATGPPAKAARKSDVTNMAADNNKPPAQNSPAHSSQEDSGPNPLGSLENYLEDISDASDSEEDFVQDLMSYFGQEEALGPDLDPKLKNMVDLGLRMNVSRMQDKEEAAKILRPANCESLVPPKVNPDIWAIMGKRAKNQDLSLTRIQGLLLKGTIPLLQALQQAKSKKEKDMIKSLGDAFRMLAMTNSLTSQLRKEGIGFELNRAFRPLASPRQPVTSLLFGDSLAQDVRDIKDRHAMGDRLSLGNPKLKQNKFRGGAKQPYKPHDKQKPFLGQKSGYHRRKGQPPAQHKATKPSQ